MLPTPFGRRRLCNWTPSPPPALASSPPRPAPRPRPLDAHSPQCTFRGGAVGEVGAVWTGRGQQWFKCLIPLCPPPPLVQLGPRAAARTSSRPPPAPHLRAPSMRERRDPLPQGAHWGGFWGHPLPCLSPPLPVPYILERRPPLCLPPSGGRPLHFHPLTVGHYGGGVSQPGPLEGERPVQFGARLDPGRGSWGSASGGAAHLLKVFR